MKRAIQAGLIFGGVFVLASVASAQRGPAGPVGIAAGMQQQYNGLKNNLTQAAEVVPEGGYGQKVGTMGEVRTYGQVIGHVANAQFGQCSGALGVPNPNQGTNLEDGTKSRADLIKGLADSFALCDKAFSALTDQNARCSPTDAAARRPAPWRCWACWRTATRCTGSRRSTSAPRTSCRRRRPHAAAGEADAGIRQRGRRKQRGQRGESFPFSALSAYSAYSAIELTEVLR
jgi:hypothetical protein